MLLKYHWRHNNNGKITEGAKIQEFLNEKHCLENLNDWNRQSATLQNAQWIYWIDYSDFHQ